MTSGQIRTIADVYFEYLAFKDVQNPKCLVLFSGVVGSGKSTIARAIEQNVRAIRLSNDEVRERIATAKPSIELRQREDAKRKIASDLLERMPGINNGLIVIDASCDRIFDYYAAWAKKYGYSLLLLRMRVPREVIEQRIFSRGDTSTRKSDRTMKMFEGWWENWDDFGREHTADMIVTPYTPQEQIVARIQAALGH